MELTIERSTLAHHLGILITAVARKSTIPILDNVKMEAGDDAVMLTATDRDVSLQVMLAAEVANQGTICTPARKLLDYAKLLENGDIKLKAGENHWLHVSAGRSKSKMVGLDPTNFPTIPPFPESAIPIPSKALASLIGKTMYAIADDNSRYNLNGGLFIAKGGKVAMVATDGHRLAEASVEVADLPDTKTLWPRAAIVLLAKLIANEKPDSVGYASDEGQLYWRIGKYVLTSRQLAGQFPAYENIIPKSSKLTFSVGRDDLARSLARVAQFANEGSQCVRLALKDGALKISASSTEAGDSEETLEVEDAGLLTIGFKAGYLRDVCAVGESERLNLSFNDADKAGVISPVVAGDVAWKSVVMPMRVG